jgi:hypothetical protein
MLDQRALKTLTFAGDVIILLLLLLSAGDASLALKITGLN